MYIIKDKAGLQKAERERASLEEALEGAADLPVVVIGAVEARLDEVIRAIESFDSIKESAGSMQDITVASFKKWNPHCVFPGCTKGSVGMCIAVEYLPSGAISVESLCEEHLQGKAQYLVTKMGFIPSDNMFINPAGLANMLGAFITDPNKLAELHARLEEKTKNIPGLREFLEDPDPQRSLPLHGEPTKGSDLLKRSEAIKGIQSECCHSTFMENPLADFCASCHCVYDFNLVKAEGIVADDQVLIKKTKTFVRVLAWSLKPKQVTLTLVNNTELKLAPDDWVMVRVHRLEFDEIAIGDHVLMPDARTWCIVEEKKDNLLLYLDNGFSQDSPGKRYIVRMTAQGRPQ